MKTNVKKYLIIPFFILISELFYGLISEHIMQSEPYLAVVKSVDNFMRDTPLKSFKSNKKSYQANEPISFEIELNHKSHLYLLTLKNNQACLLFPSYQENNLFEKGELKLASKNLKTTHTQTGNQEFVLLASQEELELLDFKSTSCIERNRGLTMQKRLEDGGAEALSLEVGVE